MDKNKYVISGNPHIRSRDSVSDIMLDVIIALAPAAVAAAYYFGFKAIYIMLISVCSSVLFEALYQKAVKKPVTINDFSAVVTGLLLSFNLPASAPFWLPVVGSFFAIIIVKQLFGGLGQNFMNPALAARAFLLASYPAQMTDWSVVPKNAAGIISALIPAADAVSSATAADAISSATPLAALKGANAGNFELSNIVNLLTGNIGGSIGEICSIALIIGGLYLISRKVISWKIPVFYIGVVAILSWVFKRNGAPFYDVLSGGLILGAFFMATDYSSAPVTEFGKVIFAVGCGIITMVIRAYSSNYPEGVAYSILLMNLTTPLIDKITRPKAFGEVRKHV